LKLQKLLSLGLILWAAVLLLAGCGSSTNSAGDGTSVSGPAAQGVLVDPYIVGAVLQEIGADGGVLQRQSTPTQADGSFSFPGPLTPGSTITIKPSPIPKHNGVDYHGILKRKVGSNASGTVVVSPLTTLLAGGASEQQVLDRFAASGLSGLSSADLYADPMAAISQTGAVTAGSRLAPLQAAMAANAFMELTANYSPDAASLSDSNFQDAVTIVTEILNSANFSALANDPAVVDAGTALTAADFVATATSLCQTAQTAVRSGSPVLNAIDTVLLTAPAVARQHYVANHGTPGGGNGGNGGSGDAAAGKVVYDNSCSSCHKFGSADPSGFAPDLANKGSLVAAKIGGGHNGVSLSATQLTDLAAYLDGATTPTPPPTPTPTPDGAALYDGNCAGCHKFGSYDSAGFAADLNNKSALIAAKLAAGHNGVALAANEVTALVDWIAANSTVVTPPPPTPTPDGAALYDASCTGCHKFGSYDTAGFAPDLNNKSALIAAKLAAGHNGVALAANEVAALVDWIATNSVVVTPPPPPTPGPLDGAALYAAECAGCHLDLANTTKKGRTAAAITDAINGNVGNMGYIVLTAEQIQAIADALPPADPTTPPGPDYSNCTACHGQPPNGSAYPNGAGAHAEHKALNSVGTNCNTCHTGAAHNGWIDLGFLAAYNAKSGSAAENPNGTATCVNVSCHGGKTTPDWSTGSINVNSDCTACHAIGTGQYNSYNSGKHSKSDHARQACTVCHNTTTLATNHFTRLDTAAMEGPASATIGGGSTRVNSYNASTRTCTTSCHGSERW